MVGQLRFSAAWSVVRVDIRSLSPQSGRGQKSPLLRLQTLAHLLNVKYSFKSLRLSEQIISLLE